MRKHLVASGLVLGLSACSAEEVLQEEGNTSETTAWLAICTSPDDRPFDTDTGDTGDTGGSSDTGEAQEVDPEPCPCWTREDLDSRAGAGFDDGYCYHSAPLSVTQVELRDTSSPFAEERFLVDRDALYCERWDYDQTDGLSSWTRESVTPLEGWRCSEMLRDFADAEAVPNYSSTQGCY